MSESAHDLLARWFADQYGATAPLTGLADNLLSQTAIVDAIVSERGRGE